jgi:hypothetical protein
MTRIVYPRLKSAPSRRELADLYTPTEAELELAATSPTSEQADMAGLSWCLAKIQCNHEQYSHRMCSPLAWPGEVIDDDNAFSLMAASIPFFLNTLR